MEKDKNVENSSESGSETTSEGSAPRARNRTVMLSPEVTGQVRARLVQDLAGHQAGGTSPSPTPESSGSSGAGMFTSTGRGGSRASSSSESHSERHASPKQAQQQAAPAPAMREGLVWQKITPVVGFLVSFDVNPNGDIFELRSGRLIITSEAAGQGNYLLIRDESVSPMHAILRMSNTGDIQVLDQLSEYGTKIKRFGTDELLELSGDKGTVEHGDVLIFGTRKFYVSLLALPAAE